MPFYALLTITFICLSFESTRFIGFLGMAFMLITNANMALNFLLAGWLAFT